MRMRERTIEIGPRAGERFAVETPSHATKAMVLAGGVTANLAASFERTDSTSATSKSTGRMV
jgi:hypothetical protein